MKLDLLLIFRAYQASFRGATHELTFATAHENGYLQKSIEIEKDPWPQVVVTNVRGHLLEQARNGRIGDCVAGLEELGIESRPADLTQWRVSTPFGPGEIVSVSRCDILNRWRCSVLIDTNQTKRWHVFDLTQVTLQEPPPVLITA